MVQMHRVGALAAVLVLVACGRKVPPSASTDASAPVGAPSDASLGVGPSDAGASSAKGGAKSASKDAGPEKATSVELAKARAYQASLVRGRRETHAKHYSAAISAFDAALREKPGDAQATSERGYARLLEGSDLTLASQDFEDAAEHTKDPKLLSQIWFNRGLVEEKGSSENAEVDFAIANQLSPSAAAQKKLGGKDVCIARVERSPTVDISGADWVALGKSMASEIGDDSPAKTAVELFEHLTEAKAEPKLPMVLDYGWLTMSTSWLVFRTGATLHAARVGRSVGGRCSGNVSFEIVGQRGTFIHVHGHELAEGGYTLVCEGPNLETRPCTEKELGDDTISIQSACLGGSIVERDLVVDTTLGRVVLAVERPVAPSDNFDKGFRAPHVEAKLVPEGLSLAGLGCTRTATFVAAADGGSPTDAGK